MSKDKVTPKFLQSKKQKGKKILALTAYDFPMAEILDEVGIDLILVGDSLGMVVLGDSTTLRVTMEDMIRHSLAVTRAVERSMVVADMPFLSYGITEEETLRNAGRLIQEANVQAVKIEGGKSMAPFTKKLVGLGIPVLGHIGMTPTHVLTYSGYHVQGKSASLKTEILEDALALEEAGALGIVLECIPSPLAEEVTAKLKIPTIGIGAGIHCDGQILVSHDLLGLYTQFQPKFVKRYACLSDAMKKAFENYKEEVEKGIFPGKEHSYLKPA
ncbi:MAG: 3-methyl-2-oxobutanoate hydroxymethyltransferase [Chlamydiae bacterium]|nr:3-methyl-2-oxobutanoate hydroxymethyltransferase [Chlamydiota bacterium]